MCVPVVSSARFPWIASCSVDGSREPPFNSLDCGNGCATPPWAGVMSGNVANQTDVYIAKGPEAVIYTPFSTYHGFRYVQIEGLPSGFTPSNSTLTSHFVHSDAPVIGHVSFKNESMDILNKIQTAILYTQQSNFHTIPTDCCQRERCVRPSPLYVCPPSL